MRLTTLPRDLAERYALLDPVHVAPFFYNPTSHLTSRKFDKQELLKGRHHHNFAPLWCSGLWHLRVSGVPVFAPGCRIFGSSYAAERHPQVVQRRLRIADLSKHVQVSKPKPWEKQQSSNLDRPREPPMTPYDPIRVTVDRFIGTSSPQGVLLRVYLQAKTRTAQTPSLSVAGVLENVACGNAEQLLLVGVPYRVGCERRVDLLVELRK